MSRAGYSDCCEDAWLYRGAVRRAITGKRGREFLIALRDAMDAMPEKCLGAHEMVDEEGSFCTLGVMGHARGIDLQKIDVEDHEDLAEKFGIAESMAREIMYENDEGGHWDEDPYARWKRMRRRIDRWLQGEVE